MTHAKLRLAFMGTPEFSVPVLNALVTAGHDIAAVYSQPPRAAGRGQKEKPSPVHGAALGYGLEVRTPASLKDHEVQNTFAELALDAAVVVAYGLILPVPVLAAPSLGCVNVHASLLPRWRGAAPIQRAILAGDLKSGVTIMQMDEGLDTGGILVSEAWSITAETTAGRLHDDLSELGAGLIVTALDGLAAGTLTATPQPDEGVTYAAKIDKRESQINWSEPATVIDRQVRAFTPWPGAWFEHEGTRLKIVSASPVDQSGAPGEVLDDQLTIACGQGALRLKRVQRAGKGPLDAAEFVKGYALPKGTRLAIPALDAPTS